MSILDTMRSIRNVQPQGPREIRVNGNGYYCEGCRKLWTFPASRGNNQVVCRGTSEVFHEPIVYIQDMNYFPEQEAEEQPKGKIISI